MRPYLGTHLVPIRTMLPSPPLPPPPHPSTEEQFMDTQLASASEASEAQKPSDARGCPCKGYITVGGPLRHTGASVHSHAGHTGAV